MRIGLTRLRGSSGTLISLSFWAGISIWNLISSRRSHWATLFFRPRTRSFWCRACVFTRTKSLMGRVIDFGIMSISLLPILQAIDVVNAPAVPHLGVVVRLKRSAKQVRTRSLVVPKELPTPPDECVDGGKALCWYEDHEAPVPNARTYITACAAYGDFHREHAAQDAVIDITHRFRRWAHTLEFSHCQASDYPHEGRMGRGGSWRCDQYIPRGMHKSPLPYGGTRCACYGTGRSMDYYTELSSVPDDHA